MTNVVYPGVTPYRKLSPAGPLSSDNELARVSHPTWAVRACVCFCDLWTQCMRGCMSVRVHVCVWRHMCVVNSVLEYMHTISYLVD